MCRGPRRSPGWPSGLFVTRHGVGDHRRQPRTYIGAARNLADGQGHHRPVHQRARRLLTTSRPPTSAARCPCSSSLPSSPWCSRPSSASGSTSVDTLRFLNPLLLGASLALLGGAGGLPDDPGGAVPLTVAGAGAASHAYLLQLFGFVQSEPFYLVLSLLGLLVLATYMQLPAARASWSCSASSPRSRASPGWSGCSAGHDGGHRGDRMVGRSAIRTTNRTRPRSWALRRCSRSWCSSCRAAFAAGDGRRPDTRGTR